MRTILFLGVMLVCTLRAAHAQDDAPSDVAKSAASLDEWLGTDANGQKWRDYLLLKSLRAEVAGDREADPAALVEIWRRFNSGEAGLEGKRFQEVRVGLESYLNKRLQLARSQVAALAKDAAANYAAPAPAAIASAEAELRQAATAAGAYFARLPVADRSHTRDYLGGQALADWAAGKQPTDEQLAQAAEKLGKYKWRKYTDDYVKIANREPRVKLQELNDPAKVNGLEGSVYTRLRTAIERLQNLRTAAAEKDAEKTLQTRVDELAAFVKAAEDKVSGNYAPLTIRPVPEAQKMLPKPLPLLPQQEAAKRLGQLQVTGQATPVRQEVFRGYSLPNLVVYTSGEFFAAGLNQDINRVRPINDVIMGTSVHGTAHIVGETRTQMLTNPLQAGYSINLGAVANSNTVGYNGPVTIFSTGVTQLHGQKKIHFDDEIGGMQPSPATTSASTCTSINNICARSRLVTRIAWKRAMASKGAAEAEASAKAADNLRTEMNQQAVESTGNVNKNFEERYRVPLIIRGEYPRQFLTASSSKLMQVAITQLDQGQLGAPTAPPPAPTGDVVAQVHESFVANYARAMLGGQTFTALEIRQMMERMNRKVPSLLQIAEERNVVADDDPLLEAGAVFELATSYLTFNAEHPVRVEFRSDLENKNPELRGELVHIVLRLDRLERASPDDPSGKAREPAAANIEISALYRVEREFPDQPEQGDYVLRRQKMDEDEPIGGLGRPKPEPIVDRGVYSAFYGDRVGGTDDTARRNMTKRFRRDALPVVINLGPLFRKKPADESPDQKPATKKPGDKESFGNWSKLDQMPTTTAKSSGGWLTLAWTMPPWKFEAKRPASANPPADKPAEDKPAADATK